jgi:hypothetical protein
LKDTSANKGKTAGGGAEKLDVSALLPAAQSGSHKPLEIQMMRTTR